MTRRLSPNEKARIRARSGLAEETIGRIEKGETVKEASRLRFDRAVVEESIDLSPKSEGPRAA